MKTFSITDTGRVRTSNQDYVFCEENAIGSFPNLFLVADGMGGHKAGDTASRMCVEEIVRQIKRAERKTPVGIMEQAIESANRMIYERSTEDDRGNDNPRPYGLYCQCWRLTVIPDAG